MASAMMIKFKPNLKLPMQFLSRPISSLIRPVVPIPQPQVTNEALQKNSIFPVMGMTQNLSTGELGFSGVRNGGLRVASGAVSIRQMGTSRSTRGSSSKNEGFDDDDVEDFDDDYDDDEDTVDFDDDDEDSDSFDEDEVDSEGFEDDEEEEKPKWKKRF